MRNRFNVDSDEKRRIISLHENSLKKNYLNLIVEQEQYYKGSDGKVGMLQGPQIIPAGATPITKQEYDTAMATQNSTSNEVKPEVKAAGNQEWLTFPGDKNYTYQKQNNKWVAKNKAGKVFDMSKYPSSVAKLEKQFPGGKAPASTPSGGSVDTNQQSSANSQVGGTSSLVNTQFGPQNQTVNSQVDTQNKTVNPQVDTQNKTVNNANQNGQIVDLKPLIGKKLFSDWDDDASTYNFIIFKATNLNCTRVGYEKGMMELQLKRIDNKGNLATKPPYGGKIFYGYTDLPDNPSNFRETELQRSSENDGWITPDSNPCKNKLDNFGHFKVV